MYKYRYPFIGSKAQRVPASALPLISLAFPSLLIVAHALLASPSRLEAHAALLGLFASVVSTGAVTNLLKIGVGRPRPNFAARCWPEGQQAQFDARGVPLCAANAVGPMELPGSSGSSAPSSRDTLRGSSRRACPCAWPCLSPSRGSPTFTTTPRMC